MPNSIYQNGSVHEGIEADPYDAYESWQDEAGDFESDFNESGDAERSRSRTGTAASAVLRRMQRQIYSLRRQLLQLSQTPGSPASIHRRLQQLERSTAGMQQSQLMALLLDQPQLQSIRFAGASESQTVEESSFDKKSLLLLQLLGQDGLNGSKGGGNASLQSLLPLLLLQDDKGEKNDQLFTFLLISQLCK
ncbi:hypothetical protein CLV84_2662 [Neolewinella xylanilytica]|uniref:Uncharacterized protein n=1 Tax=Neolewinella xylanilytica TaxID=1514080 RepID=A0A2S6I3J9_9BACT|nr:hypothetical protein [Neolewinella xylanilytica]PPK85756.1 hypothetical protein CLV84_2662 [Neolewinella xylanilytica]